jgi:hypothetical protein
MAIFLGGAPRKDYLFMDVRLSMVGHENRAAFVRIRFKCTDVILKIKQYLHSHPDMLHDRARWILGSGWDQTKWPGGVFPTAVCAVISLCFQRFLTPI